ncbi:unnamed protein product [Bursaphelenchus xylophilus]|uniref:(pine wood nematode) hypothetical protein n=1 Tax=Bursaphelenchus xylophilus TaxID=6326 RepID=A0A1I7RWT2_BURXY|nr:unnamed protein product [Bursaphelenchus xylophilus]CAG9128655.1 unnamed protein product [Bursaphelenchus xylophilus]
MERPTGREGLLDTSIPIYEDPCFTAPSLKKHNVIVVHRPRRNKFSYYDILIVFGLVFLLSLTGRCIYKNFLYKTPKFLDELKSEASNIARASQDVVEDVEGRFEEYLREFQNELKGMTNEIKEMKKNAFEENWREIEKLKNAFDGRTEFGLNKFSHMTEDELKRYLIPSGFPKPRYLETAKPFDTAPGYVIDQDLKRPEQFDWRKVGAVTGVKDQGQCGSCWAFAIVGVVEAQNKIFNHKLVPLSEQELMDCDHRDNGCGGGFRGWGFEFVKNTGLVAEQNYSYQAMVGQCKLPMRDQTRVFVDEIYSFDGDEEEMADWVATKGPITIGVNVTRGMFAYKSGVFDPTPEDCAQNSLGSHAMAVIGYGTQNGERYWLLKNSWGPAHGEAGYIRMKRGVNSCGFGNNVYTALITKHH